MAPVGRSVYTSASNTRQTIPSCHQSGNPYIFATHNEDKCPACIRANSNAVTSHVVIDAALHLS